MPLGARPSLASRQFLEEIPQGPAATNGYRLSSPTPQAYPGPPQLTEVPPVHALAMCQNRYKPKAARARKPSVGCIRPSLELCYCLRHCEAAAFQFDRYYPGYEVFFTYEQIIATLSLGW